jgi:hypothetical protein
MMAVSVAIPGCRRTIPPGADAIPCCLREIPLRVRVIPFKEATNPRVVAAILQGWRAIPLGHASGTEDKRASLSREIEIPREGEARPGPMTANPGARCANPAG